MGMQIPHRIHPKISAKSPVWKVEETLGELFHESTVGKDEARVRHYIQEQEKEDQRLDQLEMFKR